MKFDFKALSKEVCSRSFWTRMFIMVISVLLLAINYNTFMLPNNFVTGGVSGIATIIHSFISINPAAFVFVANIIFIIISFIFIGPESTGLSIIGSLLFPAFISITSPLCNILSNYLVFDNTILVAIVSGILLGISDGFIYKTGYSTGGCDIAIQLINKYVNIPTGTASFIVSGIIIIGGTFAFGINTTLYGLIIIAINSVLVDKIMLGISDSKMFYIHTDKQEEIKAYLNELENGYTIIKATGGYNNKKSDLIMCVVHTKDYYMFKNVVTKIDPNAFFVISDCYEVYGGKRKDKYTFI